MKKNIVLTFAIVLLAIYSKAETKPKTTQISGVVYENINSTEKPLAFAYVFVENSTVCTYTDETGSFNLDLPKGNYTVKVSFKGLKSTNKNISIKNSKTDELKLILNSSTTNLAEQID